MESTVIERKYATYQEYKAAVDTELQKTAESFVRIGYLLKVARDTDILKDSGYENVNEFAKAEYGIDKTMVSRFININDRFAKDGYSDELETEYRGFGYAKLSLMLNLPDVINEELSPAYSKTEVNAIKEEVDQEKEISELEVWMEGEKEEQKTLETTLEKAVHQLGHDNPELFVKLWEIIQDMAEGMVAGIERTTKEIAEILAPQGEAIYSVRVQGTGRLMLSVKAGDEVFKLINVRSEEKEAHNVRDIPDIIWHMMNCNIGSSAEEDWTAIYGEPFPEPKKEEVAPVQPSKQEKKPAPRKESKVITAKVEKEEPPVQEEAKTEEKAVEEEPKGKEEKPVEEEKEENLTEEKETGNENESEENEKEDKQESEEETENGENVENTPREDDFGEPVTGEDSSGEIEEIEPENKDEVEEILSPRGCQTKARELVDEIFELINVDVDSADMQSIKKLKAAKTKACVLVSAISQLISTLEEEADR